MHFKDVFKTSFLNEMSSLSHTTAAAYLLLAAVLGFYIFLIYRVTTRKSFYNKGFNLSLWVLTVIIAAIIIAISSNIVLSLGMVGALSIVRYRTAIKDPMDLAFLFWSIAEGILCGAGMPILAAMLAVILSLGVFFLDHLPSAKTMKILTISAGSKECEDGILGTIAQYCERYTVKSKVLSGGGIHLVIEFSSKEEKACVDAIAAISGVSTVSCLTHDGEVTF